MTATRWPCTTIRRVAWNALALFGLISLVKAACFDIHRIGSSSMAPTLYGKSHREGDLVLSEKRLLHLAWSRQGAEGDEVQRSIG